MVLFRKRMMKKYINCPVICLAAASLLAACSEDELVDGGNLPAGLYPVEIASVAISGVGSAQPWDAGSLQTRAKESGNGYTTWFQDDDKIFVKFEGDNAVGTYNIAGGGGTTGWIVADPPLYWRSKTKEENIIAWFTQPAADADCRMDISDQSDRLAYVLRNDETTAAYTTNEVNLNLKHRLAKVRVYVQGTGYEGNVTGVTINYMPTSCTVTEGKITETSSTTGNIQMYKTTVNNAICFEANVLPGTLGKDNTFTVTFSDGSTETFSRTGEQTLAAGETFTANLRLQISGTTSIDLSKLSNTYEINGSGTYFFYCSEETSDYGIQVASGNPRIYLANVNIDVTTGNAIDITGGSPTLYVQGNVSVKSSAGAGVFVASGSSVSIQSSNRSTNRFTAEAGGEAAGIGGYANTNCGNITIQNIHLTAHGSSGESGGACPGIGGAGNGTCGTITIENSTVYTYGTTSANNHAPGIGSAQPASGKSPDAPRCEISNSDIETYRGCVNRHTSYADYIGQGGNPEFPHGSSNDGVNFGGGSCHSSNIYGWTDNDQKIMNWDASGNRT